MPLGVSAHSMRSGSSNNIARQANNHARPASGRASPGKQRSAKMAALHQQPHKPPMAQPDQFSSVSTPSPTCGINSGPTMTQAPLLTADQKYPTTQALISDRSTTHHKPPLPTPTHQSNNGRQWSSEPTGPGVMRQAPPPSIGNTAVVHKPPSHYQKIQPGSQPAYGTRAPVQRYKESGIPLQPNQPINDIPGAIRRPMSFVKALEMSDALAMEERVQHQHNPSHAQFVRPAGSVVGAESNAGKGMPQGGAPQQRTGGAGQVMRMKDGKKYGSTYEISV